MDRAIFDFLKKLKKNNEKEWFQDHRALYDAALADFTLFVEDLIKDIATFDPAIKGIRAKDCLFRIYRDVRFSKDKSPYKTHLGAHITKRGRRGGGPGYYFHVEPNGKSMLVGGLHQPETKQLTRVRETIVEKPEAFRKIIADKKIKKLFGELKGDRLKTAPKGFAKDHPAVDLLKFKEYYALRNVADQDVLAKNFRKEAVKTFQAARPLVQYLEKALTRR